MAAITTVLSTVQPYKRIRTLTANATTTTDAIATPPWAKYALITFRTTVVTTSALLNVQSVVYGATPGVYDDATAFNVAEHSALTALTGATNLVVQIGPGVTGIADDSTNAAAANSQVSWNAVLPPVLLFTITNTGATTGTLDIFYRG